MLKFSSFEIVWHLLLLVDGLWHLTKFNVKIKAKSICTLFLTLININGLNRRYVHLMILKAVFAVDIQIIPSLNTTSVVGLEQILWLTLLLNDHLLLLLLLGGDLSVVLQNTFSLIGAFVVFALGTFAILVTRNASLEALTVFLQAFASFTIATFGVSLLAVFAYQICGIFVNNLRLNWLNRILLINLKHLFNLTLILLWLSWPLRIIRLLSICQIGSSLRSSNSTHGNATLTHLRIHICLFYLIICNFGSESVRISIQDIRYGFSTFDFIFAVVFTIGAMTVRTTVFTTSEAFTIEFETLGVLTGAAFSFPDCWLLMLMHHESTCGWILVFGMN